jgi:hypothetical protein
MKERSARKESKKAPAMTMMEKRDAKRAKKAGKLTTFSPQPMR